MKMKNRVLAVLALALLIINMLPVRVAEAATSTDGKNYYNLHTEVDWTGYETQRDIAQSFKYVIIMNNGGKLFEYWLSNEPVFLDANGNVAFNIKYYVLVNIDGKNVNRITDYQNITYGWALNESYMTGSGSQKYVGTNCSFSGTKYSDYPSQNIVFGPPEPVVLPVNEPGYEYWLYIYRNESTESIFFANEPFTVAAAEQEGEYTVTLPAGVKVYSVSGYAPYFGKEFVSGVRVRVKPGDVIRSSHDIQFGDSLVKAWTSGSVSYVPEANSVKFAGELPYVSAFTNYSSGGRSGFDGTKTTYWNCSIEVEGTIPEEAAQEFFIVEGKYLMPTRAYFDMCREKDIEPDYLEWKDMYYKTAILKQADYNEYFTIIDYRDEVEYNERLISLETSNYVMEMKESGALDEIYETNILNVETFVYKPFLEKIKSFMTPLEVRVTVKCVVDMDVCYGKTYTTQMFHHIAPEFPDINAIVENYYDLENREEVVKESLVGALQTQTSEYYQNLLADMQQKLNDAEIKISTLEQSLAVGDEGDLFATFSSVANGLSGLSGSFRNISAAVGNVFAFFPEEITGLLFGGFVVCILIAVYKALRG